MSEVKHCRFLRTFPLMASVTQLSSPNFFLPLKNNIKSRCGALIPFTMWNDCRGQSCCQSSVSWYSVGSGEMSQSEVLWKKEILVFPTNGFKLHLHKRYQLQEFQQFQCSQIAQIFLFAYFVPNLWNWTCIRNLSLQTHSISFKCSSLPFLEWTLKEKLAVRATSCRMMCGYLAGKR